MSNYENAPATKLLATHCAACARPLVDAVSVEAGMGPDCRKKFMGGGWGITETDRKEANFIVHSIALAVSGKGDFDGKAVDVGFGINRLHALGFAKLAERLKKAHVTVSITEGDYGTLEVKTPYTDDSAQAWRTIPGRRWDAERKLNVFPEHARYAVWAILKRCFTGASALGLKGYFQIK